MNFRVLVVGLLSGIGGCFSPETDPDMGTTENMETEANSATEDSADPRDQPTSTSSPDSGSETTGPPTDTGPNSTGGADPCEQNPCPTGAECVVDAGGYFCDCTRGGSGGGCDLLPECGNGIVEQGEACDEAVGPACSANCEACDPPMPQAIIDQELAACVPGAQSDCRAGWSMTNGQSSLQGFTISNDSQLESISLYIANDDPTVDMVVQVVDGGNNANFPSGATAQELDDATIATATASGTQTADWVEFDFGTKALELSGTNHYFIWQRMVTPFPANTQDRFRWNLWASPEATDPYPGGRSFFCPSVTDCSSQLQHWDFAFRVELTPALPICGA